MTADRLAAYVDGVCALLADPTLLERLRRGCADSAARYTLENMVARFCGGIDNALDMTTSRAEAAA